MPKLKWSFIPVFFLIMLFLTGITSPGQDEPLMDSPENKDAIVDHNEKVELSLRPDRVVKADEHIYYGISRKAGFVFSPDAGYTWESRNDGLPNKLIYPFKEVQVRHLTDLGVDPASPARVAVITATFIYLSEDYGKTWQQVMRRKPVPEGAYLTAVALSPVNKNAILLGTSFAGIFETKDRGQTWTRISHNLRFLYQGSDYWEEIAAVAYRLDDPDRIIFRCGFGQGIYQLSRDYKNAERIHYPGFINNRVTDKLQIPATSELNKTGASEGPEAKTRPANLGNTFLDDAIISQLYKDESFKAEASPDPAKTARLNIAANRFAIYVRSDQASGKRLTEKIDFIKKNGLNAMVVDFKDDFGFITYNTKLSWPRRMGAVRRKCINIEELLMKAKQNGIYVIGRIVTFQDPQLFRYQKYKYAVWDQTRNKPWSTKEYWVDPFARDVWEYNRAIAMELQGLGIDEIQFDYIRFPTDGDISKILFRYHPVGAEKTDALESFLAYARERITVPISTDLYGFSCWCRSLSYNGQNVETIADYVDVICPMFYPSHFPGGFLVGSDYLERARRIYAEGTSRAYDITQGRSNVRPYVQAFRLGKELRMTAPVYSEYLLRQIQGNLGTTSPGFTLWDYSNRYYMVTKPLTKYLQENPGDKKRLMPE